MNRIRLTAGALLAIAAMLASGAVNAQAHGPSSAVAEQPPKDPAEIAAAHAAKIVELDVWLRRLAGHYRYEGISDPGTESAQGLGSCVGVGTGPGVQCVINVTWPSTHGDPGILEPAMILYGIDTIGEGIRDMQVNSRGIPEGTLGHLKGNVVTFKMGCVNESVARPPCRRAVRIEAVEGGKIVYIWDDTEHFIDAGHGGSDWIRVAGLVLSLHREPHLGDLAQDPRN